MMILSAGLIWRPRIFGDHRRRMKAPEDRKIMKDNRLSRGKSERKDKYFILYQTAALLLFRYDMLYLTMIILWVDQLNSIL